MTRDLFQLGMRSHPFLAIAAIVAIASSAHADDADDLKRQGLKAAQDKNWELARELFQRSYERDPRPLTLFNLAVAQEHTDKLVEASASYTAFLAQPSTPDTEPFRKLARTALPALEQAIPTLTLHAMDDGHAFAFLQACDCLERHKHPRRRHDPQLAQLLGTVYSGILDERADRD